MAKRAIRFLIFSMLTTSLLVVPIVTQADAATTSSKHTKKRVRVVHQSPKAADRSASPFSSKALRTVPTPWSRERALALKEAISRRVCGLSAMFSGGLE